MNQERLAQIALHFIPGIGHMLVKQLVSYAGSAEQVFKLSKSKLIKIPGIGATKADIILNGKPFELAENEIERCQKANVSICLYRDDSFPTRLKHINDAPSLLYVKGSLDLNRQKVIAIVGTRKATKYGKRITEQIVEHLKPHNPIIVSGLAYGIDIAAHKAALKNDISTVGVLASGVNVIYPSVHRDTADRMIPNGALISENPFDSKPDAPKFPARNRIIAGMVDAVIVVEAAAKGGALITAEIANGYNRDVFAVPGALGDEFSEGCNKLIKSNKAHLLESVKDIEYIMNWDEQDNIPVKQVFDPSSLSKDEVTVILELQAYHQPMMIDNLSWKSGIPVNRLASILLNLEFNGLVNSLPGKKYESLV